MYVDLYMTYVSGILSCHLSFRRVFCFQTVYAEVVVVWRGVGTMSAQSDQSLRCSHEESLGP